MSTFIMNFMFANHDPQMQKAPGCIPGAFLLELVAGPQNPRMANL